MVRGWGEEVESAGARVGLMTARRARQGGLDAHALFSSIRRGTRSRPRRSPLCMPRKRAWHMRRRYQHTRPSLLRIGLLEASRSYSYWV